MILLAICGYLVFGFFLSAVLDKLSPENAWWLDNELDERSFSIFAFALFWPLFLAATAIILLGWGLWKVTRLPFGLD